MVEYHEVTGQIERKSVYPDRYVALPHITKAPFGSREHDQWIKDNWWMVDYSVFMDHKTLATDLAQELERAFAEDPNNPRINDLLKQLKRLRVKPYSEFSALEVWTKSAYQIVEYAGGANVRTAIKNTLGSYSGLVLEAMCGHMSYFDELPNRMVIALDYCDISLLKYPYPNRRRICCDLNQIINNEKLLFFQNGIFDAISICFGFKYPEHIDDLLREFRRILKPNGKLSFVENTEHSYQQLCKRKFIPGDVLTTLKASGYREVRIDKLQINSWSSERGDFYHVEALN